MVSPLRQVLHQILRARGGLRLEEIAAGAGVAPDEAAAMVDYWVARGVLAREEVNGGCPSTGCGSCASAVACTGTRRSGAAVASPLLHIVRPADRPTD